jgi:error-prone DNA polymerase
VGYAELVCCSNFTFQRGASHARELVGRARELGYAAIAITDECTLAGIVRAHEAALEVGIKLLVGSHFRLDDDRVVVLAPTQAAYSQLCELITKGRRNSEKGTYALSRADFREGLSQAIGIWLPGIEVRVEQVSWFASLQLAAAYIGFCHALNQDSERKLATLRKLGEQHRLELTAVGDIYYHVRERRRLHDVMTAIRCKTTVSQIGRRGLPNGEHHLRPLVTLRKLYPPDLLERTLRIAESCSFTMKDLGYEYPEELVPDGRTPSQHLRALTETGAQSRWPEGVPPAVRSQIERELALIAELGYEHFFLTVADVVAFARSRGILCQGRGSAANSAVCYALHVTEVDPARVSMLFERFVSKERHEPPDIDVDFEHQRREEVIQYIYEKYGRHRAAIAATVITYRRKSAIRDVAKALDFPADIVDALAKSVLWFDTGGELPAQLAKLGFDPQARRSRLLFELIAQIVGFPRHLSQHVGGFVISQRPLSTLVPVENAAMADRTIIQWDKDDLESLGLLKVDCLALGMLSAIRQALDLKSQFEKRRFRMQDIPAEDPMTYDMLCRAESVGVFQIESRAQMSMLPRLKPRCYYDLVTQIAIIRPGPIQGGMVHPYLRRRQGLEKITYPSPELEAVLGRTYGVPLFQEQVMQIAMVAAGFSAGEADKVRRSMAAWQRRGGLEQFRDKLIAGMVERGYALEFAHQIYQQILGFGSYGFPEAHSASFALLAYASAWLRCHDHPALVAGLLNAWPMGFYAPAQLIFDARRHRVVFRAVDVQESCWNCTLEPGAQGKPEVRLGLRLVSGLPEAQGLKIEAERRERGLFADVDELAHRAGLPRRSMALLAQAGALSRIAGHRGQAHWHAIGIEVLPDALAGASAREKSLALPSPTEGQEIVADYRSMGLTLGRHPLELLRKRLDRLRVVRSAELPNIRSGQKVRVGGIVTHRQRPETASGVVFMSLEDESGICNVIVWPGVQVAQRQPIFGAHLLVVEGKLQNEMNVIHVIVEKAKDYSRWLGRLQASSRDFR